MINTPSGLKRVVNSIANIVTRLLQYPDLRAVGGIAIPSRYIWNSHNKINYGGLKALSSGAHGCPKVTPHN
jgi:hypothetical protein